MPTLDQNLDRLDTREQDAIVRVRVVNVNIPFLQMVWLLIKLAIAAIPAAFVFGIFVALLTALFGGLFTGYFGNLFSGFHWI
jgi:uncharacterized membrane protein